MSWPFSNFPKAQHHLEEKSYSIGERIVHERGRIKEGKQLFPYHLGSTANAGKLYLLKEDLNHLQ